MGHRASMCGYKHGYTHDYEHEYEHTCEHGYKHAYEHMCAKSANCKIEYLILKISNTNMLVYCDTQAEPCAIFFELDIKMAWSVAKYRTFEDSMCCKIKIIDGKVNTNTILSDFISIADTFTGKRFIADFENYLREHPEALTCMHTPPIFMTYFERHKITTFYVSRAQTKPLFDFAEMKKELICACMYVHAHINVCFLSNKF